MHITRHTWPQRFLLPSDRSAGGADDRGGVARHDALGIVARTLCNCLRVGLGDRGSSNTRQKVQEPPRLAREGIRLASQGHDHDQPAMRARITMENQEEGGELFGGT